MFIPIAILGTTALMYTGVSMLGLHGVNTGTVLYCVFCKFVGGTTGVFLTPVKRLAVCEELNRSNCGSILYYGQLNPPGTYTDCRSWVY